MSNTPLYPGRTAVVTGAALGIGLAACRRFASLGMKVCMADVDAERLTRARDEVAALAAGGSADVLAVPTDVAKSGDMRALKAATDAAFGDVGLLMNNAVTRVGGDVWQGQDNWRGAFDVNFWGIVNGIEVFVPDMIAAGTEAAVVNVGSKQGITNPPGNTAYNVTKAAVKAYTEGLQHSLRNSEGCRVNAHLLVPGWTTTGEKEHKPGAWLPDQVVDRLIAAITAGDFYIICPDTEVTSEMDRQRIIWGALDMTENRPPLSRWHPDYKATFDAWAAKN